MSHILSELWEAGYEVSADGGEVRLCWQREEPPPRALVLPLLEEAKQRKPEILAALGRLAAMIDGADVQANTHQHHEHYVSDLQGIEVLFASELQRLRALVVRYGVPELTAALLADPDTRRAAQAWLAQTRCR